MPINIIKNEKMVQAYSLYIYGVITDEQWYDEDITPTMVRDALQGVDAEFIDVYINSPGGNVFAGHTIHNLLKRHSALIRTCVDGIAASAASVVLQAGDERVCAPNGMVMIHNPAGGVWGYAEEIRKYADSLDKVKVAIEEGYLGNINITREKLIELMNAETYMTAQEAVDMGFVDSLTTDNVTITNNSGELCINSMKIDKRRFKNIYKNSTKIKPYEPKPVVDYSELESVIVENELQLIESEVISNGLETHS